MPVNKIDIKIKFILLFIALIPGVFIFFHFRDASLYGDSGTFAGMAKHLLHGKTLYKEVWDNKPPGIFLLYAFFQWICFSNYLTFHIIQFLSSTFIIWNVLLLFYRLFPRYIWLTIAFMPSVLYVFMNWEFYLNGFFIEEYCIYSLFLSCCIITFKRNNFRLIASGFLAGFAVLCKEPFVFLFLAIFLFIVIISEKKIKTLLIFLSGAAIPILFTFVYLVLNHIWADYLHYLSFAFDYSGINGMDRPGWLAGMMKFNDKLGDLSPAFHLFFIAGIGSLFDRKFESTSRYSSFLWLFLFIGASGIPALGIVQYGHYFIPMAFFGALFSLNGLIWLVQRLWMLFQKVNLKIVNYKYILLLVFIAGIVFFEIKSYRFVFDDKYSQIVSESKEKESILRVTKNVKDLYVDIEFYGYYYFLSGKISNVLFPVPNYGYFDGSFGQKTALENRAKFKKCFIENPPEGMLTSKKFSAAILYSSVEDFARQHYECKDSFTTCNGSKAYFWSLKK